MTRGSDNTPFFVLGAARSGTTMLRLMLNRHSRLAIPFESHFLRQIFVEMPSDRPLDSREVSRVADVVVGEKNYLTLPAMLITPGVGLAIQLLTGAAAPLAPANGQNYGQHGWPEHRNIYSLIHSIYIPPVQNFVVSIEVLTGVTLSQAGFGMHVYLEGELLREIQ